MKSSQVNRRQSRRACSECPVFSFILKCCCKVGLLMLVFGGVWLGVPPVCAQPEFHRMGSILARSDRSMALELLGQPLRLYRNYFDIYPLEVSSNLTDWSHLATIVRTNLSTNSVQYVDVGTIGERHRFYRIATNQLFTALAKPTGPYAVGRTTRVLSDPSRINRYRATTNSSFVITIWYPAESIAGSLPATYIDAALAKPLSEVKVGSEGDNADRLAGFRCFSLLNAPIAASARPFPVVLYSHGYTFHRQENTELLEELASHGFICVAMDHSDSRTTVFPDGTSIRGEFSDPPTPTVVSTAVASRLADDEFVVRSLEGMQVRDPMLAGRFDLSRLGAMGWSLGISDIGKLAQADSRFQGLVILEGYFQGAQTLLDEMLAHGLRLPLFGLYRGSDTDTSLFQPVVKAATRAAYVCQVRLDSHFAFKDLTEASLAREPVRRGKNAVRACVLSFFKKHLEDQDDHLLDDPMKVYPEIFNFLRK